MNIAVIDFGAGNLRSVVHALEHVADSKPIHVTTDAKTVAGASHIVLPGVGTFGDCINGLMALDGMIETLSEAVLQKKCHFLGICVGMQMLFESGLEHGNHRGLGWLPGRVAPLTPADPTLKIPHMGWNELQFNAPQHPVLNGIEEKDHAYFVHSFHALCNTPDDVLAHCDYGGVVTAAVVHDNIIGTQFHPEKSQKTGLTFLKNFVNL